MRKTQGCGWLAKRGDVLEKHLQARLRVPFQNISGIRATNQPWGFRGNKLVPLHPCSSVKSVVSILSLKLACEGSCKKASPFAQRIYSVIFLLSVLIREIRG